MSGDKSIEFVAFFVFLLAIMTFINLYLPANYRFLSGYSLAWYAGNMITISGACVIITGGACVVALAVFGVGSVIVNFFTVPIWWLATMFFMPLEIIFIYIIVKLARGD